MKLIQRRMVTFTDPGSYSLDLFPPGLRGDYAIRITLVGSTWLEITSLGVPDATTAAFAIDAADAAFYAVQTPGLTVIVGEFSGLAGLSVPLELGGAPGTMTFQIEISRLGERREHVA